MNTATCVLYVSCWRGGKHVGIAKTTFRRTVTWPSIPPEGALINVGRYEDGSTGAINSYVGTVYWSPEEIMVHSHIENLDATNEFDSVRELIVRDDFEWFSGEPMPK
jgi:hypothetical protein